MNELFVPYEESLQLKELGFDKPCFAYYDEEDSSQTVYEYANCNGNVTGDKACYNDDFLSVTNSQLDKYGAFCAKDDEGEESFSRWTAPTFSQAFKFFRDNHNLRGTIMDFIDDELGVEWDYEIAVIGTDVDEKGNYKPLVDYSVDDKSRKFKTYEEAELACLCKLIQIVKDETN